MKVEWKTCFRVGISVFILFLCITYWPVVSKLLVSVIGAASPLILGCIIAYLVNILMSFYEKHYFPKSLKPVVAKTRRPVCMVAAFVSLLAVVTLIATVVVIQLVECVKVIIDETPDFVKSTVHFLEDKNIVSKKTVDFVNSIDWKSKMDDIVSVVTSGIGSVVDIVFKTVTSVFSGVVTFVIGFIFSVYILIGKDKIGAQLKKVMKAFIPEKWYKGTSHVIEVLNESFRKYIIGQCTEALILGVLCTIGMLILRIPYATMIGALIGVTALIPIAGAYIGAILGGFIILTESPIKALIFIIFIVILQQIEGNLIYPKVVGFSIGLPGIWVLAAITIGGGVFGIYGMIVAVPLAAAIYKLLKEHLNNAPSKIETHIKA